MFRNPQAGEQQAGEQEAGGQEAGGGWRSGTGRPPSDRGLVVVTWYAVMG